MKQLRFDDPDPRVVYDSPNVVFRDGIGVLLEPGDEGYVQLQPGDPGYQPPPVEPKPKPKRKLLGRITSTDKTQTNPNTPHTMSDNSFHYDVGPAGGGRWRPRADIQGKQTPEQHTAAVVAKCAAAGITLTAEQVAAVIKASHEETIDQAKRTWGIDFPGDYLRMMPTASTSHEESDFEGTYDNLGPNAALFLTKTARLRFATDFTSIRGEVTTEKGATITQVICVPNGADNQYKAGKLQRIIGADLDGVLAEDCGIFYIATDGTTTQVATEDISQPVRPSELNWIAPAGLTGPQTLKLVVFLNGGNRTTVWNHPLAAAT